MYSLSRCGIVKVPVNSVESAEFTGAGKYPLDIGSGKVEELISYNQLLEHSENAQDHDMGMDQELYRFRAIIGHQGPLLASVPDWKGSKYNVQVEWETGEITFEPLSIIAADDPVTCAAYAKATDLLALEGWHRFRNLAKKD